MRECDQCGQLYNEQSFRVKLLNEAGEEMKGMFQSGLCRRCAKKDESVVKILEVPK